MPCVTMMTVLFAARWMTITNIIAFMCTGLLVVASLQYYAAVRLSHAMADEVVVLGPGQPIIRDVVAAMISTSFGDVSPTEFNAPQQAHESVSQDVQAAPEDSLLKEPNDHQGRASILDAPSLLLQAEVLNDTSHQSSTPRQTEVRLLLSHGLAIMGNDGKQF